MPTFVAHGVTVRFPFEPYPQQRDYCSAVIEAAKKKQDAVLESPTGTGKTMALLTSSLAWLQSTTEKSTIFYLSRTHVQLNQAAKEMKKTDYAKIPGVVLASRKNMCLNQEVKTHGMNHSINRACQNAISKNSCVYYTNYEEKLKAGIDVNKVHDIEDLQKFGRAKQCCPFFASKKLAETQAAIVFMPYNYVMDLHVRKINQFKLTNSILIIDEGHNVEGSLKDSASAMFSMTNLKIILESCEKLPSKLSEALMRDLHGLSRKGYDPDSIKRANPIVDELSTKKSKSKKKENKPNTIEELSEKLTTQKLQQVASCVRGLEKFRDILKTDKGQYFNTRCDTILLLERLRVAGLDFTTADAIGETLESMSTFWSIVGVVNVQTVAKYVAALTNLIHFISIIFPPGTMSIMRFEQHKSLLKKHFAAYILVEMEQDSILQQSNKLNDWVMHIWCLDPAIGLLRVLDDLSKPRSLIITSGTLAPINAIGRDLNRNFAIVKDFEHVIRDDQMMIKVLTQGPAPRRYSLESTYEKAKDSKFLDAICQTLLTLCSILPFGTLVFFPSYRLLRIVMSHFELGHLWYKMSRATSVFKEVQDDDAFKENLAKFQNIVDRQGRATFMAVCRGKLSEGTNLAKNHCRSVIIVGLPYQSRMDPRINETMNFQASKGDPGGSEWYSNQMKRAVGQAIGRVIRSKDDFGMVFLCDPRFVNFKPFVSKWVQKYYPRLPSENFDELAKEIKEFFLRHDIDISSSIVANSSNQMGAFELAPASRVNRQAPSLQQSSKGSSISGRTDDENSQNEAGPRTYKDRKEALIASYVKTSEEVEKIRSQLQAKQSEAEPPPAIKKPRTSVDVMNNIYSEQATAQNTVSTGSAKAPTNKCYVCLNVPTQPYITNCKCSRTGCFSCLKVLNNKTCGDCQVELKLKQFKQKLFQRNNPFAKK